MQLTNGRAGRGLSLPGPAAPHDVYWPQLIASLSGVDLHEREQLSMRLTAAEGSAHLLHVDDVDARLTATVDVLPYCIDAVAWDALCAGLAQRLRLSRAILDDLYGEQRLLQQGIVPAELIYSDPRYARPCRTIPKPQPGLLLQSTDLVRHETGSFFAVAHRVDVAGGIGEALLARSIATRVLPEAIGALQPQGHADWLSALRESLASAAPARESPRVVMLANGADSPDFVEWAYLAMSLGYHLAQPEDAVVREGRVWLRSLGQLEPIDVLFRALPTARCDPLELDSTDPLPGLPGLLMCVREGGVAVANALGCGIVEHAALAAYLENACEFLLGESLQLPSPPTYWLGLPPNVPTALTQVREFDFVEVLADGSERTTDGRVATVSEIAALADAIDRDPYRFTARRHIATSQTATLDDATVRLVDATITTVALQTPLGPLILPGGVARATSARVIKDVWVMSGTARSRRVAPEPLPQVDLRGSVPTRAAESLFWLGRHTERAEIMARATNSIVSRRDNDAPTSWLPTALDGLLALARVAAPVPVGDPERPGELWSSLDKSVGALTSCLRAAAHSARAGRAFLSETAWRVASRLERRATALDASAGRRDIFVLTQTLDDLLVDFAALAGTTMESVVRGPAWHFWDMGRRIDRACLTLALLDDLLTTPVTPSSEMLAEIALASGDSLVAYRRRYRSDLRRDAVIDLLVHDGTNPRSVAFQVDRLREHDAALPVHNPESMAYLVAAAEGIARRSDDVTALVQSIRGPLLTFADHIAAQWFSHADAPGALASTR